MKKYTFKFIILNIIMPMLIGLAFCRPIKANAEEVTLSSYNFGSYKLDDHNGMTINVSGDYLFCVQRGYPFRSSVSDTHMCMADFTQYIPDPDVNLDIWTPTTVTAPMAEAIRNTLIFEDMDNETTFYFRGWGSWSMNEDHTNAIFDSNQNWDRIPSSTVVAESFTMEALGNYLKQEKNENAQHEKTNYIEDWGVYESPGQYNSEGLAPYNVYAITGHEGAKPAYPVVLKKMTYSDIGLTTSQVNALALIGYYIFKDPDANDFDMNTKIQVAASLCWAVESGFVSSVGLDGNNIMIVFNTTDAKNGNPAKYKYKMPCDEYVRKYIGNQYDAMKLYRQFVWKMNNFRTIPSFAYSSNFMADRNPIHLQWDADENAYVATVADANGVLKYFDFDIAGLSMSKNSDGTLHIKSDSPFNGTVTNPAKSKLLPDDCKFSAPMAWRWKLEGVETTFDYTALLRTIEHSHTWGCRWQCQTDRNEPTNCVCLQEGHEHTYGEDGCINKTFIPGHNTTHECDADCYELDCTEDHQHGDDCYVDSCTEELNAGWEDDRWEGHNHIDGCKHSAICPATETVQVKWFTYDFTTTKSENIPETCEAKFSPCSKIHYNATPHTMNARYLDWQDLVSFEFAGATELVDPVYAYISVVTDTHTFDSETDVDIKLIDQYGNEADHVKVGEMYKLRYTYTYKGASKGFKINKAPANKPYYYFYYTARMQAPNSTTKLYDLKGSADALLTGSVPHSELYIDPTPVTIRGIYTTAETPYTINGTYTFDSLESWNDSICLDALAEGKDQWDDLYDNKSEWEIVSSSTNASPQKKSVTAEKTDDVLTVTWIYETEYEVFTSAIIKATAYIYVDGDENYASDYFDEGYNYGDFEDHHYAGGQGYFSSDQGGSLIDKHSIYTQNSEYPSYAVKNKVWQSDIDIQVSNFIVNTGAGITQHIYQSRNRGNHDMNYNLYYTIDVDNPKATIFENKIRSYNGSYEDNSDSQEIDTDGDVYEFDVNTFISWGSTGASQTVASYGTTTVVDHIKTGRTYIQREIPTVLNTMTGNQIETMTFSIYPNYDRLVYEDYYSGVSVSGDATNRMVAVTIKDSYYPSNEQTASSDIFAAMNPTNKLMQPQNISGSNNVPNSSDSENRTHPSSQVTAFSIMLSNGETKTVYDSNTKNYTQYNFTFNRDYRNNRVEFVSPRKSTVFFKYSNTGYYYNGDVQAAAGDFVADGSSQMESYYISQVLFKSNYTSKYKKELEAQGAHYIEERDPNGNLLNAWVDMVNENKFAIVAAGQGFELKVTVKYENSRLIQYLSRYFGSDDAQNTLPGTSNNLGPQYCNISSMTGWATEDGKTHAYINGFNTLDRLAVNLVTGSNVYKDLYCFMSDNPDIVYSYSGIYGTPVIFERDIKYSEDYSVTTITYTMCVSHQNGIATNLQNMKFFTDQLAPDKKSPGVVEGFYDVKANGEHSITIWTPVIAATPFDYPNAVQDRYIGDAIELGYTIKTTGADDSIVHIVQ